MIRHTVHTYLGKINKRMGGGGRIVKLRTDPVQMFLVVQPCRRTICQIAFKAGYGGGGGGTTNNVTV